MGAPKKAKRFLISDHFFPHPGHGRHGYWPPPPQPPGPTLQGWDQPPEPHLQVVKQRIGNRSHQQCDEQAETLPADYHHSDTTVALRRWSLTEQDRDHTHYQGESRH